MTLYKYTLYTTSNGPHITAKRQEKRYTVTQKSYQ